MDPNNANWKNPYQGGSHSAGHRNFNVDPTIEDLNAIRVVTCLEPLS